MTAPSSESLVPLPCPFCGDTPTIPKVFAAQVAAGQALQVGVRHPDNWTCPLSDFSYNLVGWNRRASAPSGKEVEKRIAETGEVMLVNDPRHAILALGDGKQAVAILEMLGKLYLGKSQHNTGKGFEAALGGDLAERQLEVAALAVTLAAALPSLLEAKAEQDELSRQLKNMEAVAIERHDQLAASRSRADALEKALDRIEEERDRHANRAAQFSRDLENSEVEQAALEAQHARAVKAVEELKARMELLEVDLDVAREDRSRLQADRANLRARIEALPVTPILTTVTREGRTKYLERSAVLAVLSEVQS